MAKSRTQLPTSRKQLPKSPTGIQGLDEITGGGLPKGRSTLVCGSTGCGKTLLAMEFIVRGATLFNEPGVYMTFEETTNDLAQNVASLGFDLKDLIARKKIILDFVNIERSEIEEAGEFDLEGLFIRLGHAIDSIGAKRVVLDTIESLFSGLPNPLILRAELRRLFRWLKEKGVTAIITGEGGKETLTRQGLKEYISDCVILLDHRVSELVCSRRLRVVKYRGSTHGMNEYPFLIDEDGISILPITSLSLQQITSSDQISSGVDSLDAMLGGAGYFRGSSVLISGTTGTGKSSLTAQFTKAACSLGERVQLFSYEESPDQIMRNMRSIGIDLQPWVKKGLLQFHTNRPSISGLEMHLTIMHKMIDNFKPKAVIVDSINSLIMGGNTTDVTSMLIRLVDFLKSNQITALFTSLSSKDRSLEQTGVDISSLIDTWLLLRNRETGRELNREILILKSRGMAHSNQVREYLITNHGFKILDIYSGFGGVLTGSERMEQGVLEKTQALIHKQETKNKLRQLDRNRKVLETKIASLKEEIEDQKIDSLDILEQEKMSELQLAKNRENMKSSRSDVIKQKKNEAGSK